MIHSLLWLGPPIQSFSGITGWGRRVFPYWVDTESQEGEEQVYEVTGILIPPPTLLFEGALIYFPKKGLH